MKREWPDWRPHGLRAAPGEAGTADADAVAQGLAAGLDEVEPALGGRDDDGAGGVGSGIGNRIARDRGHLRHGQALPQPMRLIRSRVSR
jgi:hypothetical protein